MISPVYEFRIPLFLTEYLVEDIWRSEMYFVHLESLLESQNRLVPPRIIELLRGLRRVWAFLTENDWVFFHEYILRRTNTWELEVQVWVRVQIRYPHSNRFTRDRWIAMCLRNARWNVPIHDLLSQRICYSRRHRLMGRRRLKKLQKKFASLFFFVSSLLSSFPSWWSSIRSMRFARV